MPTRQIQDFREPNSARSRTVRGGTMKKLLALIILLTCVAVAGAQSAGSWENIAPPINDNFANAIVLNGTGGIVTGTTVDATREVGEPSHGGQGTGKSVWYRWTAPVSFGVSFTTQNPVGQPTTTNYNTILGVYTGISVVGLTTVAGNNDYGLGFQSRVFFAAVQNTTYYIAVDGSNNASGNFRLAFDANRRVSTGVDFDGNSNGDLAVFRPSNGVWAVSTNGGLGNQSFLQFGSSGDIPVPADYDGDEITDPAVFRPSSGIWYILRSRTHTVHVRAWGANGDIPVLGTYNTDGFADLAVFRPSSGVWYVSDIFEGDDIIIAQWGVSGDKPVPGDYDGDGRNDLAVFRPSSGTWYIRRSLNGAVQITKWGVAGDIPVPGDYTDLFDGRSDIAVFRPSDGTWYVLRSFNNSPFVVRWGMVGDIPQPTNTSTHTGATGLSDFVIYRPTNQTWYILDGGDFSTSVVRWGTAGDLPASAPYVVQF